MFCLVTLPVGVKAERNLARVEGAALTCNLYHQTPAPAAARPGEGAPDLPGAGTAFQNRLPVVLGGCRQQGEMDESATEKPIKSRQMKAPQREAEL